jgi:hypothetical protein
MEFSRREVIAIFELGRRPLRIARSTRTLIIDAQKRWCLREIKRRYVKRFVDPKFESEYNKKKKTFIHDLKNWTFSETCLRHEDPFDTVIRGAYEELGVYIPRDELRKISINEMVNPRPSRVYYGWDSITFCQNFVWETTLEFPQRLPVIKDNNTFVYIDKFTPIPSSVNQWIENSSLQAA